MANGTIQGFKELTPTLTRTGGTGTGITCTAYTDGHSTTLCFGFETSSVTPTGQYVFQGTISGVPLPKYHVANGVGNYTSTILITALYDDGTCSIRVLASELSKIASPSRGFSTVTYNA